MAMTLFSRLHALANLRENKVIANKKCFTVVMHSYVSQATHAFLGMLPLCYFLPFPLNLMLQLAFNFRLNKILKQSLQGKSRNFREQFLT